MVNQSLWRGSLVLQAWLKKLLVLSGHVPILIASHETSEINDQALQLLPISKLTLNFCTRCRALLCARFQSIFFHNFWLPISHLQFFTYRGCAWFKLSPTAFLRLTMIKSEDSRLKWRRHVNGWSSASRFKLRDPISRGTRWRRSLALSEGFSPANDTNSWVYANRLRGERIMTHRELSFLGLISSSYLFCFLHQASLSRQEQWSHPCFLSLSLSLSECAWCEALRGTW